MHFCNEIEGPNLEVNDFFNGLFYRIKFRSVLALPQLINSVSAHKQKLIYFYYIHQQYQKYI